jgi:hypothetical protein
MIKIVQGPGFWGSALRVTAPQAGGSPAAGLEHGQSNRERSFVVSYRLFLDCGSGFLTAITRVIVAAPLEKQRDASRGHSHQPLITA